jgi:zinc protease
MKVDRTRAPAPGARPLPRLPAIERRTLQNGLRLVSARRPRSLEALLEVSVPGGRAAQPLGKLGLAAMVALSSTEGTQARSTVEFLDALDSLGAEIRVQAREDELRATLRVLDRNLPLAVGLLAEALFEPSFDGTAFERIRKLQLAKIAARGDDPAGIAARAWRKRLYGDTARGAPAEGTLETLSALTVEDARAFHSAGLDPRRARVLAASPRSTDELLRVLEPLAGRWPGDGSLPDADSVAIREATRVYLVDKPGAAQSELRIGQASVDQSSPDFLPLTALNYAFGGTFSSRLNLNLRERRGYTYGIRSSFDWNRGRTQFVVSTSVQTRFTTASVREIVSELERYLAGPAEAELAFTVSALEQSLARQFESAGATLGYLDAVDRLGWPDDYPLVRLDWLESSRPDARAALLRRHLDPRELVVLAVGDAGAVEADLAALDVGPLARLDVDGLEA